MKWSLCLIIALLAPTTSAYDLALEVAAPDEATAGSTVTDLFTIRNLDHETGARENLTVAVDYALTNLATNTSVNDSFTITGVNSWKTAGTGSWTPTSEGRHRIEGRITNGNESDDPNPENDAAAKNVSIHDTSTLACDWQVAIVPEKSGLAIGEAARFSLAVNCTDCTGLPESLDVSYWVEDEDGVVVKKPYNWTAAGVVEEQASSLRSWTADDEGTHHIHAHLASISCKDTQTGNDRAREAITASFHAVNESCNITPILDTPVVYEGKGFHINVSSNTTTPHNLHHRCRLEDFYGGLLDEEDGVSFIDGERRTTCSMRPPVESGVNAYRFVFEIDEPGCRIDAGSLSAWQPVVVVGERPRAVRHPSRSDLDLEVDQDKAYEWGDTVSVKLDVYRGDTRKYQVRVWAEDEQEDKASSTLKVNIDAKHTRNEFTVPLLLKDTRPAGNHTIRVVAEGLGERSERTITVCGDEIEKERPKDAEDGREGDVKGLHVEEEESGGEENEREEKEEPSFRILEAPRDVARGEEFEVVVGIRAENESIEGKLYAYIYDGNQLLSEGFDGGKWSRRWDANAVNVSVATGERRNVSVALRMLDADTAAGEYVLKARLKTEEGNLEDTQEIRTLADDSYSKEKTPPTTTPLPDRATLPAPLPEKGAPTEHAITAPTGRAIKHAMEDPPNGNPGVLLAALLLVTILLIGLAIFALRWALESDGKPTHDVPDAHQPPRPPADPGCPAPLWER